MTRLIKFELLKIVGKRLFWGLLLIALLLNIFMLWWVNKGDDQSPSFSDYRTFYATLRPLDNAGKLAFLQKESGILNAINLQEQLETYRATNPNSPMTKSAEQQYAAVYQQYKDVLDQKQDVQQIDKESILVTEATDGLNTIMGYQKSLDRIRDNSSILLSTSIFGSQNPNSFSSRNIKKTVADYAGMDSIKPRYDSDKGVNLLVSFPATDLFILMIILAACLFLITDEKDKGLLALIKATRGGSGRTIAAKMVTLFVLAFSVTTLVFASTAAFAQFSYGMGDLSRPLQSLPDMMGSTLRLNVGQYLLLLFAAKALGLYVVGLLILLFTILARHPIVVLVDTVLVAAVSIGFVLLIPMTSDLNWLRVLNAVNFVMPNNIFGDYYNLHFFGQPVNMIPVFIAFAALLFVLLILINSIVFINKKEIASAQSSFMDVLRNIKIFRPRVHSRFAFYEVKKIAGLNLAALILILFALFQWYSTKNDKIILMPNDYYYRHYMVMLAGKLTPAKETFLQTEKEKFTDAHAAMQTIEDKYNADTVSWEDKNNEESPYDTILSEEPSFTQVYNRYVYIKAHPGTQFVYDLGYDRLFGVTDPDNGLGSGIRLLIGLILCLCSVFSMEYRTGMYKVLGTTEKGASKTVMCKLLISMGFAVLLFVCAYLPDILLVGKTYGFNGLSISLASLPSFVHFKAFSIIGYIILLFATRLVVCFGAAILILTLSLAIKNNVYAALVTFCALAGPPLLHEIGIHLFDHASLIPLLATNTYYLGSQNMFVALSQLVLFVVLMIMSLLFMFRKFTKQNLIK
jgi:hypothetical protein